MSVVTRIIDAGALPGTLAPDADATYRGLVPFLTGLTGRTKCRTWCGADRNCACGGRNGRGCFPEGSTISVPKTAHPAVPVALYLFSRGLTRLLVLDLDPKQLDRDAVMSDARGLRELIVDAGGACFADINPASGGIHLLVPLAEPHAPQSLRPLLDQLQRRFPTLDITPMTNHEVGCFMPPGSATREGGRRELLDATITTATDVLISGACRGLIDRMVAGLGAIPARVTDTVALRTAPGDRLHATLALRSPLPDAITRFAEAGSPRAVPARWNSPSEARFAVLVACAQRGWSRREVEVRTDWKGLWACYERYTPHQRNKAFRTDWSRALSWAITHAEKFRSPGHKQKAHRGVGGHSPTGTWLANALAWTSTTLGSSRHRHTVAAVLQGLAYSATVAGEVARDGTPLVAVGRRSLSIAAGLLPDTTAGDVLAELRELPGSPILLERRACGIKADSYALVTSSIRETDETRAARVRTDPVHVAWRILGLHLRGVYESIEDGLTEPAAVFAANRVGAATGHAALAALASAGLITRSRGIVQLGPVTLDAVAAAHDLDELREERIERFRRERKLWHTWLELRGHITSTDPTLFGIAPAGVSTPPPGWDINEEEALWVARMADGPPADQFEGISVMEAAASLVMEVLGATMLVG